MRDFVHHKVLCGSLAQLVEQRLEEPCVPSSSLGGATKENTPALVGVFSLAGLCPGRELGFGVAASSVERSHAQKLVSSMAERKRTKSAVWEEPP